MASSSVKVGLRVRPLLSKERGQPTTINVTDESSLTFKGQTFTYDHVFPSDLSQNDLYTQTAAPMLKGFLEGYNVTIMAYGQTGSGKTFTMGTTDVSEQSSDNLGLIPRFVADLFANLENSVSENEKTSFKMKVSFLEIYGEDVYDLIGVNSTSRHVGEAPSKTNNISLPVREDESGRVFVQGQNEVDVYDTESTLQLLSTGTGNRITASTAMNAGSSRSHAVFTVFLEQTVQSTASEDDVHVMTSKLTFVDLAGSERIKKTGAEGQRLKEGIQINSGLFNLGQVINSLADEQKLKSGAAKNIHVPYRNSKLTHLLKDALGGNSQTLFLACVSPAEANEGETYSTLTYAKQARNIQNKPVKNMDKVQVELRRLKYAVKAWMLKAVTVMFQDGGATAGSNSGNGLVVGSDGATTASLPPVSPVPSNAKEARSVKGKEAAAALGMTMGSFDASPDALLMRPDVQQFVASMNQAISEKLNDGTHNPSPRKIRLSMGSPAPMGGRKLTFNNVSNNNNSSKLNLKSAAKSSATKSSSSSSLHRNGAGGGSHFSSQHDMSDPVNNATTGGEREGGNTSDSSDNDDNEDDIFDMGRASILMHAVDPEETERMVTRMLGMVEKEKEGLLGGHSTSTNNMDLASSLTSQDSANGLALAPPTVDEGAFLEVDNAIQEKEEILNKLLDTVKGYAVMKNEFEKLVDAIGGLETEKRDLEQELEKAKKTPAGSSSAQNPVVLERMKERFKKVQDELQKMKSERKCKENAYLLMKREAKQCEVLQKELQKLKESKVAMTRQQRLQASQMAKLKKDQATKINTFKKADVKKQQQMNNLKSEIVKKDRVLGHKDREINRINMKLKACEEHITQLLKIQNRGRQHGGKLGANLSKDSVSAASKDGGVALSSEKQAALNKAITAEQRRSLLGALDYEHMMSSKSMLDTITQERVEKKHVKALYRKKSHYLQALTEEVLNEVRELESLISQRNTIIAEVNRGTASNNGELTIAEPAGSSSTADDEQQSWDSILSQLPNEGAKYEFSELNVKISAVEFNIDRINKEIDILNADIDELSLRLESINALAAQASSSSSSSADREGSGLTESTWDLVGKEIVAGLSVQQCQLLMWDMVCERSDTLEALHRSHDDYLKEKGAAESNAEKIARLNEQLAVLRADMNSRLNQAEKQRAADVWAMLKAGNTPKASSSLSSGELEDSHNHRRDSAAATDLENETATRVALDRALELEREMDALLIREEELRADNEMMKEKVQYSEQMSKRLALLLRLCGQQDGNTANMTAAAAASSSFSGDDELSWTAAHSSGIAAKKRGSSVNSALTAADGEEQEEQEDQEELGLAGNIADEQQFLTKLSTVWDRVGTAGDEREDSVTRINNARQLAKERVLADAISNLSAVQHECDENMSHLETFISALGENSVVDFINSNLQNISKAAESVETHTIVTTFAKAPTQVQAGKIKLPSSPVSMEMITETLCKNTVLRLLQGSCAVATEKLHHKLAQLTSIKERTEHLMMEMWLQPCDLSAQLQCLLKVDFTEPSQYTAGVGISSAVEISAYEKQQQHCLNWAAQLQQQQITVKHSSHWEAELRSLNMTRLNITTKLITLRDEVVSLSKKLQITEQEQFDNIVGKSALSDDLDPSMMLELPGQTMTAANKPIPPVAMNAAIKLIITNSASNPPGSDLLLTAVQRLKLVLESVQVNRFTVSAQILRFVQLHQAHMTEEQFQLLAPTITSSELFCKLLQQELQEEGMESNSSPKKQVFNMAEIKEMFGVMQEMQTRSGALKEHLVNNLKAIIQEMNSTIDEKQIKEQISTFLSASSSSSNTAAAAATGAKKAVVRSHIPMLSPSAKRNNNCKAVENNNMSNSNSNSSSLCDVGTARFEAQLDEVFEELEGMSMFLEEKWIQNSIDSAVQRWTTTPAAHESKATATAGRQIFDNPRQLLKQSSMLCCELKRLYSMRDTFRELVKADMSMAKHVQEMEEFEVSSKQGRAKALSGNSKLLIEEEKFRKNGKKKYEILSDRMLTLMTKLVQLQQQSTVTAATENNGSSSSSNADAASYKSAASIDVKIDHTQLSLQAQALFKGRHFKDRIELMHLNISTNGAETSTGGPTSGGGVGSSRAPLNRQNSMNNNGSGGGTAVSEPKTPGNVFAFAVKSPTAAVGGHPRLRSPSPVRPQQQQQQISSPRAKVVGGGSSSTANSRLASGSVDSQENRSANAFNFDA